MAIEKDKGLQFKATLKDIKPEIWRRFIIPADFRLDQLHDVLQVLFGWVDYHLRCFTIAGVKYGIPDPDDDFKTVDKDDSKYQLHQLFKKVGQRSTYEYDFGDGWEVSLVLEKVLEPDPEVKLPVLLDGKRAGPPEDVGGSGGYMNFLEAINDPKNDMHDELLQWIGGRFDPEAFNIKAINRDLRGVKNKKEPGIWEFDYVIVNAPLGFTRRSKWPETLTEEEMQILKELPLRRDIVMMLNYIKENKVVGTASTGNFPRKVFRDICNQFVHPPELDFQWLDGRITETQSEFDIPELMFRHILANNGYLIEGKAGSRWKVTDLGYLFLADTEAWQYWHLLVTWWKMTNWFYFSHMHSSDEVNFSLFSRLALHHCLSLSDTKPVMLRDFVKDLAEQSENCFPNFHHSQKKDVYGMQEHFIERILIRPLIEFGILDPIYEVSPILGEPFKDLQAFTITSVGLRALESLKSVI